MPYAAGTFESESRFTQRMAVMFRNTVLGVTLGLVVILVSGCVDPPANTHTPTASTMPTITSTPSPSDSPIPIETPSMSSSAPLESFPPFEDGPDADFRPETWDLSELLKCGMSQDQLMTVEGNLDSYFMDINSEEPDPAKRVTFYQVSDVTRSETKTGGWVYSARVITNVGDHELLVTVPDSEESWGTKIMFDGEETL